MSIHETERATADYLLGLPQDEREPAAKRINQLVNAGTPDDEARPKPPVSTLGEYLQRKIEVPPFLVSNGQIVRGEITATIARAGKGKTTLGMNRMIRWAAGRPLFDDLEDSQAPAAAIKTLMIENEGVAAFMQEKLGLLLRNCGLSTDEVQQAQENLLVWGDGGWSGMKVDREADLALIHEACNIWRPDLLLLEPFRGIWKGDEQDATAMEEVLDTLIELGHAHDCGILLTHHERKAGAGEDGEWMSAARGSSVIEAKAAVMENWRSVKNGAYRELSWSKSRFAVPRAPIRMIFDHAKWRYDLVAADEIETEILELMTEAPDEWYWVRELVEALSETERKIRDALDSLLGQQRVVRSKGTQERPGYRFRLKTDESAGDGGKLDIV